MLHVGSYYGGAVAVVNRCSRLPLCLVALAALGASACGEAGGRGGGRVRVRYEIHPPRRLEVAPLPPATAAPTPPPTASVPPTKPPPLPASHPPSESPQSQVGVPIRARVELEAPYEIFVRLSSEAGRVVAEDRVSEDGFGVEQRLFRVPPGRYRLRLWSHPLMERYPLYDKVVELRPDYPPRFHLGLLSVDLPEEGLHELKRTIEFELRADPSGAPVHRGPLEQMVTRTTFGDLLWGRMILPFGAYTLTLHDSVAGDDARLLAQGGLSVKRTDAIPFELSQATPSVLIDLRQLVSAGPPPATPRGGGGWDGR